jgi:hypothetical protein
VVPQQAASRLRGGCPARDTAPAGVASLVGQDLAVSAKPRAPGEAMAFVHGYGLLGPAALAARTRSVGQSRDTLLQKPLDPFVDKAPAHADGDRHVGEGYAIGDE